MALTYGFYNSLNHDRKYDSLQLSRIFDGIINDGVYESIGDALMVKASNAMSVSVGLGRAWFNHTWTLNDALYLVTITDAELALNRYDAVVLEVDSGNRTNSIKVVKGTPAVNPVKPTLITSDTVNQHPLAYIYVKAKATEITQADIQNAVGTSECPFVTGIMSTISVDNLIQQWSAEFDVLFAELEEKISQAASQTLIDKSVTEPKIANNAIVTRTIKDGVVTRAKLAQDALVSPLKFFSGNSYTIAAEDIGCTIMNNYTSEDNNEKTVNLTYDVSHSLPIGTVIAIARPEANVMKISFGENLRVGIPGNDNWLTAPTVSISNRFSTVALTLKALDAQDYWFLTGVVEVVE